MSSRMLAVLLFTAAAAIVGAFLSKYSKDGGSIWPYLLTSAWMGPLSWILMVKVSSQNMLVSSVVWNVVYEGTWTAITIWVLHEHGGTREILGAVLTLVGLMLVAL